MKSTRAAAKRSNRARHVQQRRGYTGPVLAADSSTMAAIVAEAGLQEQGSGNGHNGGQNGHNGHSVDAAPQLDRRDLLLALVSLKRGDFSVRLPDDLAGIDGKISDTFNEVIELNQKMARELERLSQVVGREGKLRERASIVGVAGRWQESIDYVNQLISDLVHPTLETARVIGAVAKGDLSQTMALDVDGRALKGEFLKTAKTVNTMVNQLSSFASEVTRVAREVGTEGKLGGQAKVKGVAGT